MKLLDLYEPFFQYICRLNRIAKTQVHPDLARVRAELRECLDQATRNASGDVALFNQVKKMELPLIFFADFVIRTSRLNFAIPWAENSWGKERNELAGDQRFFDLLDADVADTTEEAAQRLAVFYICMGLGFLGEYIGQPEKVRRYMEQIYPRISAWVDKDPKTKISEEAYQHTDTRVLTEPPNNKIILVAVAFVFLCLAALTTFYALYAISDSQLSKSVSFIRKEGK